MNKEDRVDCVGMKGLSNCSVTFNSTPVPAANVVGEPGAGAKVLQESMMRDRCFTGPRITQQASPLLHALKAAFA